MCTVEIISGEELYVYRVTAGEIGEAKNASSIFFFCYSFFLFLVAYIFFVFVFFGLELLGSCCPPPCSLWNDVWRWTTITCTERFKAFVHTFLSFFLFFVCACVCVLCFFFFLSSFFFPPFFSCY